MRKFRVLVLLMLIAIFLWAPQQANAQIYGGYGPGFNPSPQALYGPGGANTGVLYPNGYYTGYGAPMPSPYYAPYGYMSGPVAYGGLNPMMYAGPGYGQQRMTVPQALVTSAVIMSLNNNRNYGYGRYAPRYNSGYGMRGGYYHHHHHHHGH